MVEEMYDRQNRLQLTVPETATVIGVGGTGAWIAIYLAMTGVKELELWDDDTLDESNLGRLPFTGSQVGDRKVSIVSNFIYGRRPDCSVTCHDRRIETEKDCLALRGVVFCCTDKVASQMMINAYCKKNGLVYQRCGYDGTVLNVSRSMPISLGLGEENGYTFEPSWVCSASVAAALAVCSVEYKEITLNGDMSKLVDGTSSFVPQQLIKEIVNEKKDKWIAEGKECVLDYPGDYDLTTYEQAEEYIFDNSDDYGLTPLADYEVMKEKYEEAESQIEEAESQIDEAGSRIEELEGTVEELKDKLKDKLEEEEAMQEVKQ